MAFLQQITQDESPFARRLASEGTRPRLPAISEGGVMSDSNSSRWRSWHYILLWLIVIISLTLNIFLLAGLYNFRQQARQGVAQVTEILDTVKIENFELPVEVNETLPISITVPFRDTFVVPINATVPISMIIPITENISFPISDVVGINRDVTVSIVILGAQIPVDIPIRADFPINMNIDVPIDLEVPVNTTIPIDLLVEVPVDTEVLINEEVPVKFAFPVTVPLDELGYDLLLIQVKDGLRLFAELLGAPVQTVK